MREKKNISTFGIVSLVVNINYWEIFKRHFSGGDILINVISMVIVIMVDFKIK